MKTNLCGSGNTPVEYLEYQLKSAIMMISYDKNRVIMAKNVLVRNIDEETLEKLKKKAAANNRSLQEELKNLLEMHAGPDPQEVRERIGKILESYRAEGKTFSDSTEEIRKMRDERESR